MTSGATLASMTGYARAVGAVPGASVAVEIKSVNGRGLDLRLRLAPGLDALEADIRQLATKALSRGSVTINLSVERDGAGGELFVNQQALATVLEAVEALSSKLDARRPSIDGILALKGVLEQRDRPMSADAEEVLFAAILDTVGKALQNLIAARQEEGSRIAAILLDRIDEIETLAARAENHPARSRQAILDKLKRQLADLIAEGGNLPEDRLAQEALLLATKADIREELDRLSAHIASARQMIASGGAVGRRLDFLSQEFNREANTLCAKSNAVELTAIGLDLKAAIDQLREQVQNIE